MITCLTVKQVTTILFLKNLLGLFRCIFRYNHKFKMLKKLTTSDMLMLIAAFSSLIFSELLWFKGEKEAAIFIGLWVPSILGFAIFLKLINKQND
jgi:hypothetical protein